MNVDSLRRYLAEEPVRERPAQDALVVHLAERGRMTRAEVAEAMDLSHRAARDLLGRAIGMGWVVGLIDPPARERCACCGRLTPSSGDRSRWVYMLREGGACVPPPGTRARW